MFVDAIMSIAVINLRIKLVIVVVVVTNQFDCYRYLILSTSRRVIVFNTNMLSSLTHQEITSRILHSVNTISFF